jgi:hypothetical protein
MRQRRPRAIERHPGPEIAAPNLWRAQPVWRTGVEGGRAGRGEIDAHSHARPLAVAKRRRGAWNPLAHRLGGAFHGGRFEQDGWGREVSGRGRGVHNGNRGYHRHLLVPNTSGKGVGSVQSAVKLDPARETSPGWSVSIATCCINEGKKPCRNRMREETFKRASVGGQTRRALRTSTVNSDARRG